MTKETWKKIDDCVTMALIVLGALSIGYIYGFMEGVDSEKESVARRSVSLPLGTLVFHP